MIREGFPRLYITQKPERASDQIREEIERHVANWLAKGNKIEKVPFGKSGEQRVTLTRRRSRVVYDKGARKLDPKGRVR